MTIGDLVDSVVLAILRAKLVITWVSLLDRLDPYLQYTLLVTN